LIIDPSDPEIAVDDDGTLMGAVKMLPWNGKGEPPSVADFTEATIVGYVRPDAITFGPCTCGGEHE
jgi:hypothetical protein